jgi:hypothetical protein
MLSRPERAFQPGKGSGQKQTKYESETLSQGLRFANKASRIFVQTGAEAFRIFASSFVRSLPASPMKRVAVRQASKASANQSLAGRQDSGLSRSATGVKSGCRNLPTPGGALLRSGTRAKGAGTNRAGIGDAAKSRDPSRERQCRFGAPDGPGKVMVAKGLRLNWRRNIFAPDIRFIAYAPIFPCFSLFSPLFSLLRGGFWLRLSAENRLFSDG